MIERIIKELVNNPTDVNKEEYLRFVSETEYLLLCEAEKYPLKSHEYFLARRAAFSYRRESAMLLIGEWVNKYGESTGCPVSYADTLNIPFQSVKSPKDV